MLQLSTYTMASGTKRQRLEVRASEGEEEEEAVEEEEEEAGGESTVNRKRDGDRFG